MTASVNAVASATAPRLSCQKFMATFRYAWPRTTVVNEAREPERFRRLSFILALWPSRQPDVGDQPRIFPSLLAYRHSECRHLVNGFPILGVVTSRQFVQAVLRPDVPLRKGLTSGSPTTQNCRSYVLPRSGGLAGAAALPGSDTGSGKGESDSDCLHYVVYKRQFASKSCNRAGVFASSMCQPQWQQGSRDV